MPTRLLLISLNIDQKYKPLDVLIQLDTMFGDLAVQVYSFHFLTLRCRPTFLHRRE